jgi:hypothetical protein
MQRGILVNPTKGERKVVPHVVQERCLEELSLRVVGLQARDADRLGLLDLRVLSRVERLAHDDRELGRRVVGILVPRRLSSSQIQDYFRMSRRHSRGTRGCS